MSRKTELQEQIQALRFELSAIEEKERTKKDKSLVGRCFKYLNCYSCPESEADYWWLYIRVVEADLGVYSICIQQDKDGKIEIEPKRYFSHYIGSYEEITREQWDSAYANIMAEARRLA